MRENKPLPSASFGPSPYQGNLLRILTLDVKNMKQLNYIEYNRGNKDYSSKLRINMTLAEKKMWFDILMIKPR